MSHRNRGNTVRIVRSPAHLSPGVRNQIASEAERYTARGQQPPWKRLGKRYGCTPACAEAAWRQTRLMVAHGKLLARSTKITLEGIVRAAGLKISSEAARRLLAQMGVTIPRPLPSPRGGRDRRDIDPPRPPRPGPRRLTVSPKEIAWWGAGSDGGYQPSKKRGVWREWDKRDKTKPKDLPWIIRVGRY